MPAIIADILRDDRNKAGLLATMCAIVPFAWAFWH